MSSPVLQVGPEVPLEHVARMFLEYGISAVPVVDDGGELLGIVTKTDLGRAEACDRYLPDLLYRRDGNALVWDVDEPVDAEGLVAADVMTSNVLTVDVTTTPEEAARLMSRRRIHHLLVTQDEEVVGILSTMDLVSMIAGEPSEAGGTVHRPSRASPRPRAA